MRLNKMLIMGIVSMSIMGTANAAVYGTLKNDIGEAEVLQKGEFVKIVDKEDDTYIVELDSNIALTVNIEDIDLLGQLTYTVSEETKLREKPSPAADIISFLKEGELVLVEERVDDFYKVKVNDQRGYIYKEQIKEDDLENLPYTKTGSSPVKVDSVVKGQFSNNADEVVAYAKRFLGGRYVYGGNSLAKGVDCSGFTQQVMRRFGVAIERSSRAQYAANGYKVSASQIRPGDLVFYGTNGRTIDHVAIYAGGGKIIHASDSKSGIKMSKLYYGKPLIGIKRVLK